MAINFDELPQSNPFVIPNDIYKAKIIEAAMKQGKDAAKPPYLNLKYGLFTADGKSAGSIYDIISESDSSVVKYKTGRFLRACGIPLVGSMELSDIAKLVLNKEIVVDISTKAGEGERPQIDLFAREAYYTIEEFREAWLAAHPNETFDVNAGLTDSEETEVSFPAAESNATY